MSRSHRFVLKAPILVDCECSVSLLGGPVTTSEPLDVECVKAMVITTEQKLLESGNQAAGMDDLVARLIILPNSLFCASVGAVVGGWLGALGLKIDGQSHYFVWGAMRGAMVFAKTGWQIPNVILNQAAGLQQARIDYAPSAPPLRGPYLLQDRQSIQLYEGRLLEMQQAHLNEIEKLKGAYEFHKKKAEDSIIAAASVSARIAELQSFFELQEALLEKQILLMSRGRPGRSQSGFGRLRAEALRGEAGHVEEDRRLSEGKAAAAGDASPLQSTGQEGASLALVTAGTQ